MSTVDGTRMNGNLKSRDRQPKPKNSRDKTAVLNVPKLLLTYEEAAWSLGISKRRFQDLVKEYEIPIVYIGAKHLFKPKVLRDVVKRAAHDSG